MSADEFVRGIARIALRLVATSQAVPAEARPALSVSPILSPDRGAEAEAPSVKEAAPEPFSAQLGRLFTVMESGLTKLRAMVMVEQPVYRKVYPFFGRYWSSWRLVLQALAGEAHAPAVYSRIAIA